jgi:hypothetical protein
MLASCSFIGVAPPPDTPERRCTEGSELPGLDAVLGVLFTIGGAVVLGIAAGPHGCSDCGGIEAAVLDAGLVALGLGIVYDASSISGFIRTSECRDYHHARRGEPRSPPPLVAPSEAPDE